LGCGLGAEDLVEGGVEEMGGGGLGCGGGLFLPVWECLFEPVNGVSPLRDCGLTDCVLVAKKSNLVYGFINGHGL
jgi:hypothetical protein